MRFSFGNDQTTKRTGSGAVDSRRTKEKKELRVLSETRSSVRKNTRVHSTRLKCFDPGILLKEFCSFQSRLSFPSECPSGVSRILQVAGRVVQGHWCLIVSQLYSEVH